MSTADLPLADLLAPDEGVLKSGLLPFHAKLVPIVAIGNILGNKSFLVRETLVAYPLPKI